MKFGILYAAQDRTDIRLEGPFETLEYTRNQVNPRYRIKYPDGVLSGAFIVEVEVVNDLMVPAKPGEIVETLFEEGTWNA